MNMNIVSYGLNTHTHIYIYTQYIYTYTYTVYIYTYVICIPIDSWRRSLLTTKKAWVEATNHHQPFYSSLGWNHIIVWGCLRQGQKPKRRIHNWLGSWMKKKSSTWVQHGTTEVAVHIFFRVVTLSERLKQRVIGISARFLCNVCKIWRLQCQLMWVKQCHKPAIWER